MSMVHRHVAIILLVIPVIAAGSSAQDPTRRRFFAPFVEQLLRIERTENRPVRKLHVRGIEPPYRTK